MDMHGSALVYIYIYIRHRALAQGAYSCIPAQRELFSAWDPRVPKGGPGRPKGGTGRPPELQKPPKRETKGRQKGDKSEAVAGGEALWIHKYVYIDRPNAEPRDGFRFCSERSPLSAQARLPVLLNIASLPLIRYGCDNNVI